jgi:hypothetical protein
MISELIIAFTVLFTLGFVLLWLCKPGLRQQLEQPKYQFLEQLSRHEQAAGRAASAPARQLTSSDP